jgi:hypothetical protein
MISGIRTALDVPVRWREAGEELFIFQGVMKRTGVSVQREVEAFCSRGGNVTVVNSASSSF